MCLHVMSCLFKPSCHVGFLTLFLIMIIYDIESTIELSRYIKVERGYKKPKGIPMYMVRHNVFWIGDDVWWHKNEMYVSLGTLYLFVVMKILNTQTVLCSMMLRMQSACGCILLLYKLH